MLREHTRFYRYRPRLYCCQPGYSYRGSFQHSAVLAGSSAPPGLCWKVCSAPSLQQTLSSRPSIGTTYRSLPSILLHSSADPFIVPGRMSCKTLLVTSASSPIILHFKFKKWLNRCWSLAPHTCHLSLSVLSTSSLLLSPPPRSSSSSHFGTS